MVWTTMVKNRFEQVDELQDDAITLTLKKIGTEDMGSVSIPAVAHNGQTGENRVSGNVPAKDAYRNAIRLGNQLKLAVVVCDPESLWQAEWGSLYRPVS